MSLIPALLDAVDRFKSRNEPPEAEATPTHIPPDRGTLATPRSAAPYR